MNNQIPLCATVQQFAAEMQNKLDENCHKGGWHDCTWHYLRKRLREETAELEIAVASRDKKRIVREAADVANFAMMIADTLGVED